MRFNCKLIISLLAVGAFAQNEVDVDQLTQGLGDNMSISCMAEAAQLDSCSKYMENNNTEILNLDDYCNGMKNCPYIVNNLLSTEVPNCDPTKTMDVAIISGILMTRLDYITKCSKDENGNYCPLSEMNSMTDQEFNNKYGIDVTNTTEAVKQLVMTNCISEQCRQSSLSAINLLSKASDILTKTIMSEIDANEDPFGNFNELKNGTALLESEECVNKASTSVVNASGNANANESSSATINKVSGVLTALSLLLLGYFA